ncbi:hypothetical protein [Ancylobacter sp. IITR112]|uniref:hypothetical protein n=1 Tax=Ancylobacter sp. IITR112 TaxID=3138073 RepID=UPI00352BBA13
MDMTTGRDAVSSLGADAADPAGFEAAAPAIRQPWTAPSARPVALDDITRWCGRVNGRWHI